MAENVLDFISAKDKTSKNRAHDYELSEAQNRYISYKAGGGILVQVGNKPNKVSKQDFANSIGYNVRTLLRWEAEIPNFWQKVKDRREVIMPRDAVANVWMRIYLDAMAGKPEQQKMIVGRFDNWRPPAQAHDIQMSGWADVINKARQRKQHLE